MIEKEESKKALLNMESNVRGVADVSLGLYIIESYLRFIQTQTRGTTLELAIFDSIEKHAYNDKKLDIHNAICGLLYEVLRDADDEMKAACHQYFVTGGPFPNANYVVEIDSLFAAILKIRRDNYDYLV